MKTIDKELYVSPLHHLALLTLLLPLCLAACSREETGSSHQEIVTEDFEAIIELEDKSCGGITSFQKIGELHYQVTCKSGEVYQIHVSHEGNVDVSPHDS